MKRFGILLIVAMFGLVLACGSQEEESPCQTGAPPAKAEKVVPVRRLRPHRQRPPPAAPEHPKPEHPKAEHPK